MEAHEAPLADAENALETGPAKTTGLPLVEAMQDRIVRRFGARPEWPRAARINHAGGRQALLGISAEERRGKEQLIADRRVHHRRRLDQPLFPFLVVADQRRGLADDGEPIGSKHLSPD